MLTTFPGTTIEVHKLSQGSSRNLFEGLFATGGITLSQVFIMTGLEPYLVQNWVKRGFLSPPKKRVYSRVQFARIIIINMLKQINLKKDTLEYKQLFKEGYFSWKSDEPVNEESWNKLEKFVYNYFNIIPINTAYKLEFINNLDNNRFNIEINTDRSRYATIRFDLWDFYKNLEIVCPQEEQITLNKFVKCLALKYKNN